MLDHTLFSAFVGGRSDIGFEVKSEGVEIRVGSRFGSGLGGSRDKPLSVVALMFEVGDFGG